MKNSAQDREVVDVLSRYGICAARVLALKVMRGGLENVVVRATLVDGVAVIHRYLKSSVAQLAFGCLILEKIAGRFDEVLTPKLRRTVDGGLYLSHGGDLFTVYDYLRGSHPVVSSPALIRDVCQFAQKLQADSLQFEKQNLERCSISQLEESVLHFIKENHSILVSREIALLNEEVSGFASVQAILDRFPRVIVHGDLHGGNLLVDSDGRLSAILDFDDACWDSSVLEFAGIVRGHCFDDEGAFLFPECAAVYREAGASLTQLCSLNEFVKVVRFVCIRYALQIFNDNKRSAARMTEQRVRNQWLDFRRWSRAVPDF